MRDFNKRSAFGGGGNSVNPSGDEVLISNSSPQRGEEAILSEQKRTLGVQVRGEVNSHTEEQHLQSDTNISCHTERKRKYPVINSKELSCNKSNYIEINNQLDCFGSKEPHNDVNIHYSRHTEQSEVSHSRENITNNAILRGLYNCSPQKDGKNSCCLMRGEVRKTTRKVAFTLAEVLITLGIIGVVAAMTLPTLIQNHQKQVYANSIKKAVSVVSNMFTKMQADEGASDLASTSIFTDGLCRLGTEENPNGCEDAYGNPSVFKEKVPKYLKVVKTCEGDDCDIEYDYWGSFSNKKFTLHSYMHGKMASAWQVTWRQKIYGFYTADGMVFYFIPANNAIQVAVDTNGRKGPNQHGRDLFYLAYCTDENGKFMPSSPNAAYVCVDHSVGELEAYSPLYHLINNGWKMDY